MNNRSTLPVWAFFGVLCIALAVLGTTFASTTPALAAPDPTGNHCGPNQHQETIQVEKCEWVFNWHTWKFEKVCHFEDRQVCVDNPPPPLDCDPGEHEEDGECVPNGDGGGNCGQNQGNGNDGEDNGYGNDDDCNEPEVCEDPTANNEGEELPCTYDPPPVVCEDPAANNNGQEGECTYDPPPPEVCEDPTANNEGEELPCTYDPPPVVCEDPAANNNGQEGECTYDPPVDPCLENPQAEGCIPPVVVTPVPPPSDPWNPYPWCLFFKDTPGCPQWRLKNMAGGDDLISILRSKGIEEHLFHPGR